MKGFCRVFKVNRRMIMLGLLLLLTGCGYRPVGSAEAPTGAEPPTLAIPLFANRSTEVGLESLLANTFIQTFGTCKALRLTPRPEGADLVLEGKVDSVANSSVAYFNISRSLVRRVTVRVELQLVQRRTGKVIWRDVGTIQEDYVVNQTYQQGEAFKEQGMRRGAATLARKMLDKILLVI
uniref:Penicillin-binding protein activator LpoB n=1 Tax=Desulfobacca acetoxidans TaxID=60893 RepID=A0A7V4G7C1_9BACT